MLRLRNKKTGKRGELHYYPDKEYHFAVETKDPTQTRIYKTLGDVLKDWEDFIVRAPLIEDEKIRKAVRAWAEASDVGVVKVAPFAVFDIESTACIYFFGRVIEDKDYDEKKSYTIAELCGEEE